MKIVYVFLVQFIFLFLIGCSSSSRLINLSDAKKTVIDYYENGQYEKEMKEIIDEAIKKFEGIQLDKNSAAIFDVDETTLSNYEHIKSMDFGDISPLWKEWIDSKKAKAITQTKRLYDFLISKKVKIIFITGRKISNYLPTKENLISEGYKEFDTLITRNENEVNKKAVDYKINIREQLTKRGYIIIGNIGDQLTDLEGENSGVKIKLQNYLYKIE